MSGKTCQICNKPSGMYPLCYEHMQLKNEGKVVKDESTGKWILVETNKTQTLSKKEILTKKEYKNCIICNKASDGKPLCKECFHECKDMEDEIDRNKKTFELKDYYFNLKSANYRVISKETIIKNLKMMYALSNIAFDSYDDSSLISRINDDAIEIIDNYNKKKEIKETSYTEEQDSQKSSIMRTLDGHIVKSQGEVVVDNLLYNNQICHCYEKDVIEISSAERTIKSDWFVPVTGNKGIYIEYWGMSTSSYIKNKDEKRKLYKEHKIPLIEIEKDDVKDVSGLNSRIIREINTLKEEIKKTI